MELRLRRIQNLVLVRHGQSVRNKSKGPFFKDNQEREKYGNCVEHLVPLTEKGLRQARGLGKGLKKKFGIFDCVIHSGYQRARQTAGEVLKAYSKEELREMVIGEDFSIRERDSGYFANFTEAEVQEYFPWWGNYWLNNSRFLATPFGGESVAGMCEGRLTEFFRRLDEWLPATYDKSNVLLVSHGRAIHGMRYLLEGWDHERVDWEIRDSNPPNCSVTYYRFDSLGKAELQFANKVYR